jgi:SAM-dependent methyltransferase
MVPNPSLVDWFETHNITGHGKRALKIGCGLGDDAEFLQNKGFDVIAFDISETAIQWCRHRFPQSSVEYLTRDLFQLPRDWRGRFDFILESYTLQVLLPELREDAIRKIASPVAPGGTLLVICRGRDPEQDQGQMPWPLTRNELRSFGRYGLTEVLVEDYIDAEDPPVRRFRVEYRANETSANHGEVR